MEIKRWGVWISAFVFMILFVILTVHFIKSKNPDKAAISVILAFCSIYLGMKLAGIERSEDERIKEMEVLTLTFEISFPIITAFSVWKLASSYGTKEFEILSGYFFVVVQLFVYSILAARLYYWLKK
ncbi:hypothetical protein GBV73_10365 [Thermococcus sp. 101 C5]|uniref:hypothetical protein n=1 Tax=Thermococcus sp. 101 C5 TaxID=2654197 RepID=UPI00128B1D31|nr:hypothetical protein [Thermococcus sp. 101 C5]MPW40048.1 hypothetical protein [Thermococcus sp. 101 C5]